MLQKWQRSQKSLPFSRSWRKPNRGQHCGLVVLWLTPPFLPNGEGNCRNSVTDGTEFYLLKKYIYINFGRSASPGQNGKWLAWVTWEPASPGPTDFIGLHQRMENKHRVFQHREGLGRGAHELPEGRAKPPLESLAFHCSLPVGRTTVSFLWLLSFYSLSFFKKLKIPFNISNMYTWVKKH